jgi:hypothetical protein
LVACLCLGFYVLLIELNLSHVRSVLLAVSIFAVYSLLLLWASVTAIRNPPTDPYAAPRFSPELCAWLTTAAKSVFGWPLGLPMALIAGTFKRVKEAGKKKNDEPT